MRHPVAPVAHRMVEGPLVHRLERQVLEDLLVAQLRRGIGAGEVRLRLHDAKRHPHHAPAEVERQPEGAAMGDPVGVEVGRGDGRERRHQAGRLFAERRPLHVPEVAAALRRDLAGRPRLLGCPLDDVVAVLAFEPERIPGALALVAPAHVGVDDGVAAAGQRDEPVVDTDALALHAVRRPDDDRRVLALGRRPVDVGEDGHAVAKPDGFVMVDQDGCGLRGESLNRQRDRNDEQPGAHSSSRGQEPVMR